MAWLDGQQIPEDLIRKDDERRVDFRNAIGTLDGYSMIIKEIGGDTCAIHPLVQLAVQYTLEQSGQRVLYTGQALQLIAKRFPVGEHENKAVCGSLLPHAQAVLQYNIESDATASSRAGLLHNVGWFEWQQGRYESAYQNVQAAYQIRQKIFGDEVEDTVGSLGLLALVLRYQGKYEQAEEMHRQALGLWETVLGKEHPDTLTSVYCLAYLLSTRKRFSKADGLYQRAPNGYGPREDLSTRSSYYPGLPKALLMYAAGDAGRHWGKGYSVSQYKFSVLAETMLRRPCLIRAVPGIIKRFMDTK
jgi:tetratricopeptide (TPR) repeat protein